MSAELSLLTWSVVLMFAQMLVAAMGANLQVGLSTLAGNREDMPALTGWAGRARRAHLNMLENLVLFAALVLVAHAAGKTSDTTVLGAQLFFWGRVVHAGSYIAGIPYVRTLGFFAGYVGMAMIFISIVR